MHNFNQFYVALLNEFPLLITTNFAGAKSVYTCNSGLLHLLFASRPAYLSISAFQRRRCPPPPELLRFAAFLSHFLDVYWLVYSCIRSPVIEGIYNARVARTVAHTYVAVCARAARFLCARDDASSNKSLTELSVRRLLFFTIKPPSQVYNDS